ncbi:uncharacterized protein JCM10292_005378 [Rhodotorula paludigena]|uniref:uncharacterized protein n=1 Tax=Rhodotorula paludigena TaxID=86838 RepID=UPI00317A9E6D
MAPITLASTQDVAVPANVNEERNPQIVSYMSCTVSRKDEAAELANEERNPQIVSYMSSGSSDASPDLAVPDVAVPANVNEERNPQIVSYMSCTVSRKDEAAELANEERNPQIVSYMSCTIA